MPEASPKGIQKVTITDFNGDAIAGGTGGGPASIADGLDVAQGTTTDAAWVSGAGTVISLLKKIASSGAAAGLTDAQLRATPVPVSGTFWQATQPISAAALPLPTGASTEATLALLQVAGGTAIGALKSQLASAVAATSAPSYTDGTINPLSQTLAGALRVGGTVTATGPLTDTQLRASAVPVSGTFFQATQPISAVSLPLPTGAALDATLTGGTQSTKIVGGSTAVVKPASTIAAATDPSLVVTLSPNTFAAPVTGTFWQATQPVSIAATVTTDPSDRAGRLLGIVDKGKLWDGTNIAAVKAASTAPLATDPALVVTISPNSPSTGGGLTDTQLRATPVPVSGTFWQATQPVSIAAAVDISDRAGRLLGIVDKGKIWDGTNIANVKAASTAAAATDPALVVAISPNNAVAVTGTFWQATQPVSIAAAVDVSDRAGRLLGIVDKGKIWDGTNIAAVKAASTTPVAADPALVVGLHPNSNPTKVWDGSNTAAVKAASTAAAAADPALVVSLSPNSPATTELSTGLTTFCNTNLLATKTAVKASAGKVFGWMIHNPSAATVYIQVWNVAIASITVGTTAPTWVIPLPAGASANVFNDKGVTHSTEINIAATTTATGLTAPGTGAVVSIFYV